MRAHVLTRPAPLSEQSFPLCEVADADPGPGDVMEATAVEKVAEPKDSAVG